MCHDPIQKSNRKITIKPERLTLPPTFPTMLLGLQRSTALPGWTAASGPSNFHFHQHHQTKTWRLLGRKRRTLETSANFGRVASCFVTAGRALTHSTAFRSTGAAPAPRMLSPRGRVSSMVSSSFSSVDVNTGVLLNVGALVDTILIGRSTEYSECLY